MSVKIGIVGQTRSGKDTFAKMFIDAGYKEFKFGDGIGEVIDLCFPDARKNGKPRKHYQHVGQELRKLEENVWIDFCFRTIDRYIKEHPETNIIITDVRQLNEVKALRAAGYTIIKVEATEEIRIARMIAAGDNFTPECLNHETEIQAKACVPDILVTNNGTLKDLHNSANIIRHHLEALSGTGDF